jgi:competence ComEA-like helix-hairpin-helix protein
MLNYFRKFGLTKRDFILVISLIITLFLGLIIKWTGWKDNISKFDYSSSDSIFENKLTSSFKQLEQSQENKDKVKRLKMITDSLMSEKDSISDSHELLNIGKKININFSYASEMELLPGIGKVMAERIVEYREHYGEFRKTEEIMNVKGIGQMKFNKIKNLITIDTLNSN